MLRNLAYRAMATIVNKPIEIKTIPVKEIHCRLPVRYACRYELFRYS